MAESSPRRPACGPILFGALILLAALALLAVLTVRPMFGTRFDRTPNVLRFLMDPQDHQDWKAPAKTRCGNAPFIMPATGYIGYLWGDSFQPGHAHQGLDIFAGTEVGLTPVYAAYAGYLTRNADWKSAVIIRIPDDPLQPGRQIWTYYAHMADPSGSSFIVEDFPPGTQEKFVEAGTLLGYQGNYSGNPAAPTGVHLHISIVLDNGQGGYLNELDIDNTLDPSPYFGLQLNAAANQGEIPLCVDPQEVP